VSSEELAQFEEMGPVDYVILEWPHGGPTGDIAPMIVDLANRGLVTILDIAFITKDSNGTVTALDLEHLGESAAAFAAFEGASSGLLDYEDLQDAGNVLETDSSAAVIIWENRWLAPLGVALRKSGAQLVSSGRLPVQALLAAVDALEATTT
jgi:dihydroorotase-like cyclic amidohydrolase